ncbi:hypothetical protein [Paraliobacillus ryukyuensis]|uniref:hypothetical protein n=1 Tax=Paraliobacillus ryukyuensis TaxID=200904 RepID=UPI0009A7CC18|nr:hypothetical protein [Paraliobacillus ryukyuensis]
MNRDFKVNEEYLVTDTKLGLVSVQMRVVSVKVDYIGNPLILEMVDKNNNYYTINPSQSLLIKNALDNHKDIKMIKPKKVSPSTSQPIYVVIENYSDAVTFIDDLGNKRTLPLDHVEIINKEDMFKVVQDLSSKINNLKQIMVEMTSILSSDINVFKEKIKDI